MKYSEAKKAIEALSSKYNAYKDEYTEYFNVYYKNEEVAYVKTNERYSVTVWFEKYFKKLPFSNKLYMILSELAITPLDERMEEKKHYIKVFNGLLGFLNVNTITGRIGICSATEAGNTKTKFTDEEIEQLKRRDDVPLNWNKVRIWDVD